MVVVITGGLGYIGSYLCASLLEQGTDVIILDNLENSELHILKQIEIVAGRQPTFFQVDLCDFEALNQVFDQISTPISCVYHLAAKKAVGESIRLPLAYYNTNVTATINLLRVMDSHDVRNIIFSSTCCLYKQLPMDEEAELVGRNPYAKSKIIVEGMLKDLVQSDNRWSVIVLRYFNVVGAHQNGLLGESPKSTECLFPVIIKVLKGEKPFLEILGSDYETEDGTCLRDFTHITDLIDGHKEAYKYQQKNHPNFKIYNLGTGKGTSVMQVFKSFESISKRSIPIQYSPRRPGDATILVSDPSKAAREFGWKTKLGLTEMITDTLRFNNLLPQDSQ
jgi:UDP-glucose 4-epimerase